MIPTHALGINGTTWMDLQEIDNGAVHDLTKMLQRKRALLADSLEAPARQEP